MEAMEARMNNSMEAMEARIIIVWRLWKPE